VCTIEQDLQEQGLKVETQVLSYESKSKPPEHIRDRLRLPKDASVGSLSLTRLVQDRKICFERRYFPSKIAARFDPSLTREKAVIDILQELTGMRVTEATWGMQIIPASAEVAKALGIIPGVLTLEVTSTEFLENGHPVHAGMVFYRVDRVKLEFTASETRPSLRIGESWRRR
jgi:DNA-binding GntR family transcriptional regulator